MMRQAVVVAVAQEIWQEVAIGNPGAAETTKPGVADGGVRSPVLTGGTPSAVPVVQKRCSGDQFRFLA